MNEPRKSARVKDLQFIPTTQAELKIATDPDGIRSVLPRSPRNLDVLVQRNIAIGKFDLEYAFALQKQENLEKLHKKIAKSIADGSAVHVSDLEAMPILHAKIGRFGVKIVECLLIR